MSVSGPGRVIDNGLVLYLDASNIKSIVSGSTTWFDVSRNNNSGSLVNGPAYTSAFNGGIVFDGTNDFISVTGSNINNNFSYDIWCLPQATHQIDPESNSNINGVSGQRYLIGANFISSPNAGAGVSVGTNGVSVYEHSDGYMPPLLVHETTINSPINIVVNYTNKQPSLYLNSQFIKNGFTSTRTNVRMSTDTFGKDTSNYGFFNGVIYSIKCYNRTLSASEILTNYNLEKKRFGL